MRTNKKVALVLGGGGALGVAHIGFLEVLIKNDIPIDIITGTSMGALVGGVYASGASIASMKEKMIDFKIKRMVDFQLFSGGIVAGNKLVRFIRKFIKDNETNIEDFKIKFAACACDMNTGDKVIIDKGDIVDAIRASISIPGVFKPFKKDNMTLVDGGLVDNMPVEDARKMGADVVIAVDVHCFYYKRGNLNRVIPVARNAMDRMIVSLAEQKLDKGDIHIKVKQPKKISMSSFGKENTLLSIKAGRKAALQALPQIRKLLEME